MKPNFSALIGETDLTKTSCPPTLKCNALALIGVIIPVPGSLPYSRKLEYSTPCELYTSEETIPLYWLSCLKVIPSLSSVPI